MNIHSHLKDDLIKYGEVSTPWFHFEGGGCMTSEVIHKADQVGRLNKTVLKNLIVNTMLFTLNDTKKSPKSLQFHFTYLQDLLKRSVDAA